MLIPYSTERELERVPWATISLIAANVVVAAITFTSLDATMLLALNPDDFHIWQPLTAMFIHAGVRHLVGNMLVLWVFGSHVEDTIGIPKYLLLYFSAGIAADVLQIGGDLAMLGEMRGGLGASGCIMGVVAIFATRYRKVRVNFFYWIYYRIGTWPVAAIYVAVLYVGMDLVFGALGFFGVHDGVGHFAHLGGFAAGIGWAYALRLPGEVAIASARDDAARMRVAGAFGPAAAALEAALKRRPGDAGLHKEAAVYFGLDDRMRSRAVHHWSQALRLWMAHGPRGLAADEWVRAKRRYSLREFAPDLLCDMGVMLEVLGDYEGAAEAYDAASRHPRTGSVGPTAGMRLAGVLEAMGQADRARESYARVVEVWPDSPESLDAAGSARRLAPPPKRRSA
ncbi:MAG TPA: rhomboid family intramembrane serine protease [Armatimonadota bacterium]|nr:rhomboid family intramembrane serine protease [Armatimonadota bacterium]